MVYYEEDEKPVQIANWVPLEKVAKLKRECGVYATACHLRKQGYSLQQAVFILATKRGCHV